MNKKLEDVNHILIKNFAHVAHLHMNDDSAINGRESSIFSVMNGLQQCKVFDGLGDDLKAKKIENCSLFTVLP